MYANRKLISLIWPGCGMTWDSIHMVPAYAACWYCLFLVAFIQLCCFSSTMRHTHSYQMWFFAKATVDLNRLCVSLVSGVVYLLSYWRCVPFPQMQIFSQYLDSYIGPPYTTPYTGSIYVLQKILTLELWYLVSVPLCWWSITQSCLFK